MNGERLFRILGLVDEDLIEEAASPAPRRRRATRPPENSSHTVRSSTRRPFFGGLTGRRAMRSVRSARPSMVMRSVAVEGM